MLFLLFSNLIVYLFYPTICVVPNWRISFLLVVLNEIQNGARCPRVTGCDCWFLFFVLPEEWCEWWKSWWVQAWMEWSCDPICIWFCSSLQKLTTLSLCQLLILVPIQPASRALADVTGDGQFLVWGGGPFGHSFWRARFEVRSPQSLCIFLRSRERPAKPRAISLETVVQKDACWDVGVSIAWIL